MKQVELVMPPRKLNEPGPVWVCNERIEGGAKCTFCLRNFKSTLGSNSTIVNNLLTK